MSSFYEEQGVAGYSNPDHDWDVGSMTKTHNDRLKKNISALPEQLQQARKDALSRQQNEWSVQPRYR